MSEPDLDAYALKTAVAVEIAAPDLAYRPPLPSSYRPRIALVGAGGISAAHLDAYREMGLDVAVIANRTLSKAEARRDEYFPKAEATSDIAGTLARDDIAVVDITPHPAERYAMIETALRAGKHVLSQKPFETFEGGIEWRVEAAQFPISSTMTGVVLEMEPGALRELHWHPNAAEWQYVLSGQLSVTLFGSKGRWRQEVLNQGDVGYIPQGFGHSIENLGADKARILIVFNSGHYQTIDLSQWIAGNPVDVLSTNFGQDPSVFEGFPRKDVFMTK